MALNNTIASIEWTATPEGAALVASSDDEATFRFDDDDFLDLDDRIGGALPELYVRVYDSAGECVLSTRANAERNAIPTLIRIPVSREVAQRHKLI